MKRRQFLSLAPGAFAFSSCSSKEEVQIWKGVQMGIDVSISYRGKIDLEPVLKRAREAEAALTLWESDSPLSQLNQHGSLANPPAHLLRCLEKAHELYQASGGAFDPTVRSYLEWLKSEYHEGGQPADSDAKLRRELVDFSRVEITDDRIAIPEGVSLDLNGIAQGYLTDVVAESLTVESALVNFGEFRVVGEDSWPVEVKGRTIDLSQALAVSSGSGQRFSATAPANHLIHPRTGESPIPKEVFAIEADEAWLADGLATLVAVGGKIPSKYTSRANLLEI